MSGAILDAYMTDDPHSLASHRRGHLQLLQLPETALDLVLQQLDACSLASTAATCSKLRYVLPRHIRAVALKCDHEVLAKFISWVEQHSSSLKRLTECSLSDGRLYYDGNPLTLERLACPHLRQMKLQSLLVQLHAPGVLHECTGLTALDLLNCDLSPKRSAFAAIAALQELQQLRVILPAKFPCGTFHLFPVFQHPMKLTHLSISYEAASNAQDIQQLTHLAALVNLQHLDLARVPSKGYPGGWPSQLVKLTCFKINYDSSCDVQQQFQHLRCLTALQQLAVSCNQRSVQRSFPGLQHLPQLTSLSLDLRAYAMPGLEFSTSFTHTWAHRTALQSLALKNCIVQPQVLAALTQLRTLSLGYAKPLGDATHVELLLAVSQLSQLTELRWHQLCYEAGTATPPAAAFTALTASSNLRSLHLSWRRHDVPQSPALFQPDVVHPHLRRIDQDIEYTISCVPGAEAPTITEEQLQLLPSCCPALEDLTFRSAGAAHPQRGCPCCSCQH